MTRAAKAIFDKYDADNSGYLDKAELTNYMIETNTKLNLPPPTPKEVEEAFSKMDENNDGKLQFEECKSALVDLIINLWTQKENEAEKENSKTIRADYLATLNDEDKINSAVKAIFDKYDIDGNGHLD